MPIAAAVALIQPVIVPADPAKGRYVSALSNVSVDLVFAYPINCPNNSCGGKRGCRSDHGFYCTTSSGTCQTSKCIQSARQNSKGRTGRSDRFLGCGVTRRARERQSVVETEVHDIQLYVRPHI